MSRNDGFWIGHIAFSAFQALVPRLSRVNPSIPQRRVTEKIALEANEGKLGRRWLDINLLASRLPETLRRRLIYGTIETQGNFLWFGLFAWIGLSQIILESFVEARAGGGRASGFRGSRSYRAPARPAQPSVPSEVRREPTAPAQPGPFAPQGGGFMRGLGTAMFGGFLGSMLFSGIANAGFGGLGGSGFGLIEILLLAGLGYFLLQKFRRPVTATSYGSTQYQSTQPCSPPSAPVQEATAAPVNNDIDYRSLTLMDRSFAPARFLNTAQDIFFKVQGAWNKQDGVVLKSLCGAELMQSWQEELDHLRARGQQNRMENIALRESEITEVWTESGEDFATVRLRANLLDYTVDAKTGAVVSGSNSDPIEFEEYWTFSRPVGPNEWKLTAVQQA